MTYPVKYMVVAKWYGYKVIDTSWAGGGVTVTRHLTLEGAHKSAYLANTQEGYRYDLW